MHLLLALSLLPAPALACSRSASYVPPPPLSVQQAFEQADAVFEGKVASAKHREGTFLWDTEFAVSRRWKGSEGKTLRTETRHTTCAPYPFEDTSGGAPATIVFYQKGQGFLDVEASGRTAPALECVKAGGTWRAPPAGAGCVHSGKR